jgi:hypothetical protein
LLLVGVVGWRWLGRRCARAERWRRRRRRQQWWWCRPRRAHGRRVRDGRDAAGAVAAGQRGLFLLFGLWFGESGG